MGVSIKEPLSTDFSKIPEQLGDLDPERRKNLDVCIRFLDRWHRFDVDGFLGMMTPDGIMEEPYRQMPDGENVPERRPLDDVRNDMEVIMRVYGDHDCLWLEMHATENPALFVYKSQSFNRVMYGPCKGNVYSNKYVVFMEVEGDKIARFTEYFNPEVEAAAFNHDQAKWKATIEEAAAVWAAEKALAIS